MGSHLCNMLRGLHIDIYRFVKSKISLDTSAYSGDIGGNSLALLWFEPKLLDLQQSRQRVGFYRAALGNCRHQSLRVYTNYGGRDVVPAPG